MKAIINVGLLLGLMVAAGMIAGAQETEEERVGPNLVATGRYYGDSIVLRWAAIDYPTWQTASRAGFVIERSDPERAEKGLGWELLTPEPIRPLTIDEWKARYRPEDTLAGAAVQTLYGETMVTEEDPFGSIYETWMQQRNMHGFGMILADVAPRLADGMGLRFVDRSIKPESGYVYRIRSLADDPTTPIDTAGVVVMTDAPAVVPSVRTLSAVEGENLVTLQWERSEHPQPFSGYFIEQSFDGGRTFSRLKEIPFIPANNSTIDDAAEGSFDTISYKVELTENYRPVTYRVVGVDAFGDTSPESHEIVAMGRDMTPPAAPLVKQIEVVQGDFLLQWKPGNESDGADDLAGFYVGRAGDANGPFEAISELLPRETRSFTHTGVDTLLPGYYVVGAVDTAGNLQNSVALFGILPDSIPPMTPRGLAGEIDSNGVVTLRWDANTERDLQGYRVFFANQEDHEFQQLTTGIFTDTVWRDTLTLQTLSEKVYYRVTALDQNFNHAPFTEILALKKPDIIAPVPPVVTAIRPSERGIALEWYRSPSGDALRHILYRRNAGSDQEWRPIFASDEPTADNYLDTLVERGGRYEYALIAADDDGNSSAYSNVVHGRTYDSGLRPGLREVSARYDAEKGVIRLDWSGGPAEGGRVKIYRSINEGRAGLIGSITLDSSGYVDRTVIPGATYSYRVKVVTSDGGESEMSETAPITTES